MGSHADKSIFSNSALRKEQSQVKVINSQFSSWE